MAAARVNWHGQDLPVVREIVRIGGVETVVEIPNLAEPELRQIVALLATLDRFEGAARLAPDLLLELVAGIYIKHGGTPESWRAYEASLGIPRSRTKQPKSFFHAFLRWANGGGPDNSGKVTKLAAVLDIWVALGDQRPDPTPKNGAPGSSDFHDWLSHHRGWTVLAQKHGGDSSAEESQWEENLKAILTTQDPETIAKAILKFAPPLPNDGSPSLDIMHAIFKRHSGNGGDGKNYVITPPEVYKPLDDEFHFDFDPCPPDPKPSFDGLTCEWGKSNYVNPPFRIIIVQGKKIGATAWAHKTLEEWHKGKGIVFVYPISKWILEFLAAGAEVRNLGDIHWLASEDRQPGKGTGRDIACFVFRSRDQHRVWVVNLEGHERVYETREAAKLDIKTQLQEDEDLVDEVPIYDEPADNFDLEHGGEYLNLDPNSDNGIDGNGPLLYRIKGRPHPPFFLDVNSYWESGSVPVRARSQSQQGSEAPEANGKRGATPAALKGKLAEVKRPKNPELGLSTEDRNDPTPANRKTNKIGDVMIEALDKDQESVPLDDPSAVRFHVFVCKKSPLCADGIWYCDLGCSFETLAEAEAEACRMEKLLATNEIAPLRTKKPRE